MVSQEEKQTKAKISLQTILVWLPFTAVFTFSLLILVLSFIPITINSFRIQINLSGQQAYVQLALLLVLLITSLVIPLAKRFEHREKSRYNHPLGLPRGSIRGIIALAAALAYITLAIKQNASEDVKNIFLLVLAFYFITRASEAGMEFVKEEKQDSASPE